MTCYRLIHGDAVKELPHLVGRRDQTVVITDPVWPNALETLAGADDPYGLFAAVAPLLAEIAYRVIVILGCDRDPRFLAAVPPTCPFRRLTWLRFAVPAYHGPILSGANVAYVFGDSKMAFKGQRVWPGEILAKRARDQWQSSHPCPLRYEHCEGLVRNYTREGDTIIDPFAGSGTVLDAAVQNRRSAVGIDIVKAFLEEARLRLDSAQRQMQLAIG